jgi:hypothetical protein
MRPHGGKSSTSTRFLSRLGSGSRRGRMAVKVTRSFGKTPGWMRDELVPSRHRKVPPVTELQKRRPKDGRYAQRGHRWPKPMEERTDIAAVAHRPDSALAQIRDLQVRGLAQSGRQPATELGRMLELEDVVDSVMGHRPFPGYIKLLCPWKRRQGASNEVAFQRSKRKTGNNEPHSNRRCSQKDGADRRTRMSSGPIGIRIGTCAQSY